MLERAVDEMSLEISTILKLAMLAVDKYSAVSKQPGFVTVENGKQIKVRFEELSRALRELSSQNLAVVHRCEDCDNWSRSPKGKTGSCFPKEHSCGRGKNDFCSKNYVPRSKERRAIDEAVSRLSSEKRTRNGS